MKGCDELYMGVCLLSRDYQTNFCRFAYDNWENDKQFLPTLNTAGCGVLAPIKSTSMGSLAIGTISGEDYILTGENQWIKYTGNFGGGGSSSGGSSDSGGSSGSSDGFIEL